jgi:hypothetical protein
MTDPKPIPRVTHDEALEALAFVARCTMPAGKDLYESVSEVANYIKQQKAASATRKADVATVREFLERYHSDSTVNVVDSLALSRALDRLGKE